MCLLQQRHPLDDSDEEWDEYISRKYGQIALEQSGPEMEGDHAGLDVAVVFHDTFGRW
jgi:hypothetical protein